MCNNMNVKRVYASIREAMKPDEVNTVSALIYRVDESIELYLSGAFSSSAYLECVAIWDHVREDIRELWDSDIVPMTKYVSGSINFDIDSYLHSYESVTGKYFVSSLIKNFFEMRKNGIGEFYAQRILLQAFVGHILQQNLDNTEEEWVNVE